MVVKILYSSSPNILHPKKTRPVLKLNLNNNRNRNLNIDLYPKKPDSNKIPIDL